MAIDYAALFHRMLMRYQGASAEGLIDVICPIRTRIASLNRTIDRLPGQKHWRATFCVEINDNNVQLLVRGRTGKFVPASHVEDNGIWKEIAKGRIIEVDGAAGVARGEIYAGTGGSKAYLSQALEELGDGDYLEIDQYGASAKVLSGLVEYSLAKLAQSGGFRVRRMPEDMARHLGEYPHYDFEFERAGVAKRVEVKSLWGTDTRYARLIHSISETYPTSSCRFDAQDLFAVSLFLRTGDVRDFAFARSVSIADRPFGLPNATDHLNHVHQNPSCEVGNGSWFASIDEVWNLA